MSFDESNFEKLDRFERFDPDENIFNNLSQIDSVFYAVEEAPTSLKL